MTSGTVCLRKLKRKTIPGDKPNTLTLDLERIKGWYNKNSINFWGYTIFSFVFTYGCYRAGVDKNELTKNGIFVNGVVLGTQYGKSNYFIRYKFNYKKAEFYELEGAAGYDFADVRKFLVGKSFPVLLSEKDNSNNTLLLTKKDFERYGLVYPDSLRWVCDSLKLDECN